MASIATQDTFEEINRFFETPTHEETAHIFHLVVERGDTNLAQLMLSNERFRYNPSHMLNVIACADRLDMVELMIKADVLKTNECWDAIMTCMTNRNLGILKRLLTFMLKDADSPQNYLFHRMATGGDESLGLLLISQCGARLDRRSIMEATNFASEHNLADFVLEIVGDED